MLLELTTTCALIYRWTFPELTNLRSALRPTSESLKEHTSYIASDCTNVRRNLLRIRGVEKLMSLFDENKSDADEPEEPNPTDYTGVIILAILFPVLFFFRHIGKTDTGLNVAVCLGMCLVAIRIRWDLRTQLWFWGVIAFVLALHVPLFLMVQWPHAWVPG